MTPEEHEGYVGNMERFRNEYREEGSRTTGEAASIKVIHLGRNLG